jgi:predicted nucleotidyltransferase component of viral defense system
MALHLESLDEKNRSVLEHLGKLISARGFLLGGGTAVALHLGHRTSVDLDLFTEANFAQPLELLHDLRTHEIDFQDRLIADGTLHGSVNDVSVSLLRHRYPCLSPPEPCPELNCSLLSLDDLCAMKIAAVTQRGTKRDFVDIYALGTKHRTLEDMLRLYRRKYSLDNVVSALYGLAHFSDAESEPMPRMLWTVGWSDVKQTIQSWVKGVKLEESC